MEVSSKGLQSEFIFHNVDAVTTDLGDCLSVRTPDNTDYFFGNFLLYPAPPTHGDYDSWMARYGEAFGDYPAIRHHTFQWLPSEPADPAAITEFTDAGFTFDETSVLQATSVHTDKPAPEGVIFRFIQTDAEWQAVVDAQTRDGFPQIPTDEYRRYKEESFAKYRKMSEQGLGNWWGAFKGDELVADMGLFFGEGVGRFQAVGTAREHRRQGICRAMVNHVSQHGFDTHPGVTLFLWADAHDVARGIYCSVGYEEIEVLQSVFRPPNVGPN